MKLPQECPSCKADLTDRNPRIPPGYEGMFSLVLMDKTEYQCPVCNHVWPREPGPAVKRPKRARKGRGRRR